MPAYTALTLQEPFFLVAPAAALKQKLLPASRLQDAFAYVVAGEELNRQAFLGQLQEGGYECRPIVEERGEFSVRGGIIDLFPPLYAQPVRVEFFGDEVESLRFFDPASQRSKGSLDEVIALPVSEVILDEAARDQALQGKSRRRDPNFWRCVSEGMHFPGIERHLAEFYPETHTLWDYLPPETVVVEWETSSTAALVADLTRDGRYGSSMGVLRTVMDVGQYIGPVLTGWMVATSGYGSAFTLLAAILAGTALLIGVGFRGARPS